MENSLFVFLPIEITNRELDYKLNLARYFCKFGFNVILGNSSFLRDELKYKNYKGIFIEKGVLPVPEYYELLKKKGLYLYDLSDEGLGKCVYAINYKPTQDALTNMRKILLWGQEQKNSLVAQSDHQQISEAMHVIGNPAFDLALNKFKPAYKILRPVKFPQAYILVNTNFVGHHGCSLDECIDACKEMSPQTRQLISNEINIEKKQFPIFYEWLDNIIQFFPHENFVVRPHPCEIQENYIKLFGKYSNVIISKEGNVNQAIASAKLVLHKDCSTAMQSYLMKVPVISLGGISLYKEYAPWPLAFSAFPETLDDAKKLIYDVCLFGKFNKKLQSKIDIKANKILKANFHNIGNSSEKLVDFILKDAEQLIQNKSFYKLIDSRTPIQKLKVFIRKMLPLHYKMPKAVRETFLKITKKDILDRLFFFESVSPLGVKFKVKKVFQNAFELSRE